MSGHALGLIELLLVFGAVVGWAAWELWSLRALRKRREQKHVESQRSGVGQAPPH